MQTELISSESIRMRVEPVRAIELLVHELQQKGDVKAYSVYEYIKAEGRLSDCLSERDGQEIQALDCYTFKKIVGEGVSLLLWRSPQYCENPEPKVPLLSIMTNGLHKEVLQIRMIEMSRLIGKYHQTPRIFRGM